jgi:hypothetical protein
MTRIQPISELKSTLAEKLREFELLPNGARLLAYYGIGILNRSQLDEMIKLWEGWYNFLMSLAERKELEEAWTKVG